MSRLRKILSAFLSTLMIVSAFVGVISFGASVASTVEFDVDTFGLKKTGTSAKIDFRANPGVYEVGDGYNVIWVTTFKGTGYIKYTYEGKEYTVYDEDNGVICTNEDVHTVKVPHEHLANNTYTVYSQVVTANNASGVTYGATISSGEIPFKGYDGSGTVNVLQITDTHDAHAGTQAVVRAHKGKDVDLVAFTGDIANDLPERKDILDDLFPLMANATGGRFPIIYCRGNHETRGKYGTMLLEYFETKTGEFYFDFNYGPLYGVVLDTGEDKSDSDKAYGGLANYKEYIAAQAEWLKTLTPQKDAAYRLAIYHIPRLQTLAGGAVDISKNLNPLGFQLGICGHDHSNRIEYPGTNGVNFEQVVLGQSVGGLYEFNGDKINYVATDKNGSTKMSKEFTVQSKFGAVGTAKTPIFGLNQKTETRAGGSNEVTAEPTVFETGDNYYTIVWATSKDGGAYVEYTYNGKQYQVYDEAGGFVRTTDTIHTVKVPKAHLNNNTYRVACFNMRSQSGYTFSRGSMAVSKDYKFENNATATEIPVLVCPDIGVNLASDALTRLSSAVAALGSKPAIVSVNGDSVADIAKMMGIVGVLQATHTASGGTHPVVYTRGAAEMKGEFASRLGFYLRTTTGEFYYSFNTTNYTFIVLDDAALCEHCAKNAGELILPEVIREKQTAWLNSLEIAQSKDIVVISHEAAIDNEWMEILRAKGAPLVISACSGGFSVDDTQGVVNVEAGGFKDGKYVVSMLTVKGDSVDVKATDSTGAVVYEQTLSLAEFPREVTPPADTTPGTDPATTTPSATEEGGCGSSVGFALVPAVIASATLCVKRKKKDD
ncbi:MAG: metallophosphoesterase [Clostridia bacterium]|nr:metallophosphoesterase [Clostridia bacterium]